MTVVMRMRFRDRHDAGKQLAVEVSKLQLSAPIILGLPRGGIPVAFEVAEILHAPLDALIVRKLGVPSQPELAMGAIGEDGVRVLNSTVVSSAGLSSSDIESVEDFERDELERRTARIRAKIPKLPLVARDVVVVDDGVATGATARAACLVASAEGAVGVTIAVPVAPRGWQKEFRDVSAHQVALQTPRYFQAVGYWYEGFSATSDEEVLELLTRARLSDSSDDEA
jgi:predicted phosphoribosyltransferase